MDYTRNWPYISKSTQDRLTHKRIVLCGAGLGSIIAEIAVRTGFRNFLLIDGDTVEAHNLNRQNYVEEDIGKPKVEALKKRLMAIDHGLNIDCQNKYVTRYDGKNLLQASDIVINCFDFDRQDFLSFDDIAKKLGLLIIHPFNLCWAGGAIALTPESDDFSSLPKNEDVMQSLVKHISMASGNCMPWLQKKLEYLATRRVDYIAQLSVGAIYSATLTIQIMVRYLSELEIRTYPFVYIAPNLEHMVDNLTSIGFD
ncbi:ThiF family adenylyltransferase [Zooshikella sp. RANM57]|uniref:ThiF family adenylyltransferase n=1 Tax=Zooshikella sp. RANM57 TaxID=3425863 RepID=UPI003D6E42D0